MTKRDAHLLALGVAADCLSAHAGTIMDRYDHWSAADRAKVTAALEAITHRLRAREDALYARLGDEG